MLDFEKYCKPEKVRVIHPDIQRYIEVPYSSDIVQAYDVKVLDPSIHKQKTINTAKRWANTYHADCKTFHDVMIENNPFKVRVVTQEQNERGYFVNKALTPHGYLVDLWSNVYKFVLYKYGSQPGGNLDCDFVFARSNSTQAKQITLFPIIYFDISNIADILN